MANSGFPLSGAGYSLIDKLLQNSSFCSVFVNSAALSPKKGSADVSSTGITAYLFKPSGARIASKNRQVGDTTSSIPFGDYFSGVRQCGLADTGAGSV